MGSTVFLKLTPRVVLQPPHPCTPIYKHSHTDTYTCTKIKTKEELILWDHWGLQTSPDTLQGQSYREALRIFGDREEPISAQSYSYLSLPEADMWTKPSHHLNSGGLQSTEHFWGLT